MFGFVSVSEKELTDAQRSRYGAVYCGICREIRSRCSEIAGLSLSYDLAFLALLLGSLYEPEETQGDRACAIHPIRPHKWVKSDCISYAADMNVALAYFNCLDDIRDGGKLTSRLLAPKLEKFMPEIRARWPRQCAAIESCIRKLSELESGHCPNPDEPAGVFGTLMEELFLYRTDHWESYLRAMGNALGRFIYLCDAAMDRREDAKKENYNPFLAMQTPPEDAQIESWLVMTMGSCTAFFEMLPMVQDKEILDNILYSGVWLQYRSRKR